MSEPAEGAGRTKTGLMGHLRPTPVPMQIGPSQAESELSEIPNHEFRIWTLNPPIVRFSCARQNGFEDAEKWQGPASGAKALLR